MRVRIGINLNSKMKCRKGLPFELTNQEPRRAHVQKWLTQFENRIFRAILLSVRTRPSGTIFATDSDMIHILYMIYIICQWRYPKNVKQGPFQIGTFKVDFDEVFHNNEWKSVQRCVRLLHRTTGRSGNWQEVQNAIQGPFPQFWSEFFVWISDSTVDFVYQLISHVILSKPVSSFVLLLYM